MVLNTKNRKLAGLVVMIAGLIGFFGSMRFFRLIGFPIDYSDPANALKMLASFLLGILGLYFGLSLAYSKKLTLQIAGSLGVFCVLTVIAGFFIR